MKRSLISCLVLLGVLFSYGQAGSFDSSFHYRGWKVYSFATVTNSNDETCRKVLLQGTKTILLLKQEVSGQEYFLLARYNPDGSLDHSFALDGYSAQVNMQGTSVALQPDGKILVSANFNDYSGTGYDFVVLRYTADGILDVNFGQGGSVRVNFDAFSDDYPMDIAVQADGKIVIAGYSNTPQPVIAIARLNANGSLDTSFDTDGKLFTSIGSSCYANSVGIQGDGKIVVAGRADIVIEEPLTATVFCVARYTSNGSLDNSFSTDGIATSVFIGNYAWANAVLIQPDGKIIAGGTDANDFALARYNSDGSPDTDFGSGGVVSDTFTGCYGGVIQSLNLQSDNKIVATGYTITEGTGILKFALARYTANGSPDTAFGSTATVTTSLPDTYGTEGGYSIMQSDGKIVVGGGCVNSSSGNLDYTLLRYTSSGDLDASFNSNGVVLSFFPGPQDASQINAIAVQSDGKVVSVGKIWNNNPDFMVLRTNLDGSLDNSFGTNGVVFIDFTGVDEANAVAIQGDGKIVVAGTADASANSNFALARLNTDGTLDNSFGIGGKKTTDFGFNYDDEVNSILIQADGQIVVAGSAFVGSGYNFAVARYNADGSLDNSFGTGGLVRNDFYRYSDRIKDIALQSDGKIVAAGEVRPTSLIKIAVVRYNSNGTLDTDFGNLQGLRVISIGEDDWVKKITLQADGKILVGGYSRYASRPHDIFIARLNADGTLDSGFDTDGMLTVDYNGDEDELFSLWVEPNGKVVAGGDTYNNTLDYYRTLIVRHNSDGTLDTGFGNSGFVVSDLGFELDIYTGAKTTNRWYFAGEAYTENDAYGFISAYKAGSGLGVYYQDADSDGFGNAGVSTETSSKPEGYVTDATDCNDANPAIHPGATEICDGIDNNCNGQVDEGVKTTYYRDFDGDLYGDAGVSTQTCSQPAGYVTNNTDCDDFHSSAHPGATEICDGLDNDCDGSIDEGLPLTTYYRDSDGDSYGDAGVTTQTCSLPAGYVTNNTDCNDGNADIHPGATEVCDGIDNNCDGTIDEGVTTTFYRDADGDSYGNEAVTTQACSQPTGYVSNSTDCNDANAQIHPGAVELCDGIDNDCDGLTDEGVTLTTYYMDADGDGYGSAGVSTQTCSIPTGYVSNNTDCNDANEFIHPGASEVCDGVDNDCDGLTDEGVKHTYYRDADGDGYGAAGVTTETCTVPAGYVGSSGDCNDNNAAIHPGAIEVCNGIDDDCDGTIDEGVTFNTYYRDADGDGYGAGGVTTQTCTVPAGYVESGGDCNDDNAAIHPGATEVCDGIDNDCDGMVDEGVSLTTYYRDADEDTYGAAGTTTQTCGSAPAGYVSNNTDCDDSRASVHPGAPELCDGLDNDCDGSIDEGITLTTYYRDADGDTYGAAGVTTQTCGSAPAGYVGNNTDCNDANGAVNPGATEICDGIDNDCDGLTDEGVILTTYYRDADGDGYGIAGVTTQTCGSVPTGYVSNNTDCNDANAAINPGASEICDGVDNNCNGSIDEGVITTYYRDADRDGYGNPGVTIQGCSQPRGYVANNTDCNDANGAINPGATEICDGIDNDCDGTTDEGCATLPSVSINDQTVSETAGTATLTVTLSKAVNYPVTVNYATQDNTAVSNGKNPDYRPIKGAVTFNANELSKTITVIIRTDMQTNEGSESFFVNLALSRKMVGPATISDGTGIVTITDGPALLMLDGLTRLKNDSQHYFTVNVIPNPSESYFNLLLESSSNTPVSIRVMDVIGRLIESPSSVSPNSVLRIGQRYHAGVYYAECIQGSEKVIVKLVKQ